MNGKPDENTIWIEAENGMIIFGLPKMGNRSFARQLADVAFMLCAVNSHSELKRLAFETGRDRHYEWNHDCYFGECKYRLCREVVEAIVRAEVTQ